MRFFKWRGMSSLLQQKHCDPNETLHSKIYEVQEQCCFEHSGFKPPSDGAPGQIPRTLLVPLST